MWPSTQKKVWLIVGVLSKKVSQIALAFEDAVAGHVVKGRFEVVKNEVPPDDQQAAPAEKTAARASASRRYSQSLELQGLYPPANDFGHSPKRCAENGVMSRRGDLRAIRSATRSPVTWDWVMPRWPWPKA